MRRKTPQDRSDAPSSSPDSTPHMLRKIRFSPPTSGNSPTNEDVDVHSSTSTLGSHASHPRGGRSRRIDHGSADWRPPPAAADAVQSDGLVPPPGSPGHSPGATVAGLHHRHRKPSHEHNFISHPSSSKLDKLRHPLATQQVNPHHRKRPNLHGNGLLQRSKGSPLWKRMFQCLFGTLLAGYLLFIYLAQNHYWKEEHRLPPALEGQLPPHRRPAKRPSQRGKTGGKGNSNKVPSLGRAHGRGEGGTADHDGDAAAEDFQLDAPVRKSSVFALGRILHAGRPSDERPARQKPGRSLPRQPAEPSPEKANEWNTAARSAGATRRTNRRRRTRPPVPKGDGLPLWYDLEYSSQGTISSVQRRWDEGTALSNEAGRGNSAVDVSTYPLCGIHAKEASKSHPENYLPPFTSPAAFLAESQADGYQPLGPNSRVMITGILTPLGLHLALALHRQCNVTSFLGLDVQMPNDPLGRLEQQERLAVLMTELDDARELQVPFMGLEVKRTKKTDKQRQEEREREARLAKVREAYEAGARRTTHHARPYQKYGIALTPGAAADGTGPLAAVLDYRPTHVVHLAGTQSDALLNSEPHGRYAPGVSGGDDRATSRHVFRNRGEEEDEAMREGLSARPHLYDLRMGATGMEQLLSAVVAQAVMSPGGERYAALSESDKARTKRPHVVYASSYDALRFRDAAERRKHDARGKRTPKAKKHKFRDNDEEVLGSVAPHAATPPRGLHGASRLVDELLASSYHALHGVSSVGLRFDAIYGPRGFGVPSASIPMFHVDRVRRRRGLGPDVGLAEAAVRRLHRRWMGLMKEMEAEKAEGGEDGDEEEAHGTEEGVKRRLGEDGQTSLIEEAGWTHLAHDQRDFVFVEDAVGAIISAMQYRSANGSPTTFNIGSGETSTLQSLSDEIQQLATTAVGYNGVKSRRLSSKDVIDVERSSAARAASLSSKEYLRWSATTSLGDGAAKLLAWHLDRSLPFFPPASLSEGEVDYSMSIATMKGADPPIPIPLDGEGLLRQRGISSCDAHEDPVCMGETHASYPCASECSVQSCIPSVFDSILENSHEATEDCEVVLYTMALGYDVEEMTLETEYSDGEEQEQWMETTVCTIAFVPSESSLVREVIDQVPPNEFEKREIDPDSSYETKVEGLNGYLAHNGWVLILVDGATKPMTAEDMFLAKLAPARLFHETVRKAMFVDENFSHIPYPEDAQFLASETSRGKVKKRTLMGLDEKGHKTKYRIPEEPQRRAVLLISPMRHIPDVEGHKMPLREITESMMKEQGLEADGGETKEIRIQREYYERARSAINSMDLRSPYSIRRHKIEMKDFIRSRWIVHHLKLEEGHQLRCEWYREHIKWSTHLDQLSFAYIMAKRELARKITTRQPLPPEKTEKLTMLQQIIRIKSDAHEWHPIINAENSVIPLHHSQISPEAIPQNLEDQYEITDSEQELAFGDEDSTFYVRIMSDDRMLESRKRWIKARNSHRKRVKEYRESESEAEE